MSRRNKSIPTVRIRNVQSTTHGKNGIGRLTFHRFCSEAEWITTYQDGETNRKYTITVKENSLDSYSTNVPEVVDSSVGTLRLF